MIHFRYYTAFSFLNSSTKKHQHRYVPKYSNALVRTFTVGDLLTVERSQNLQKILVDNPTPKECLEGLIPALDDFHLNGNFLEVCDYFQLFYRL